MNSYSLKGKIRQFTTEFGRSGYKPSVTMLIKNVGTDAISQTMADKRRYAWQFSINSLFYLNN